MKHQGEARKMVRVFMNMGHSEKIAKQMAGIK